MTLATRHHRGFTLIEIMVVITIIGILTGMIVMNIVTTDPRKALDHEAQRLLAVIEMARDEALFGRQDIGIVVTENGYSFARYGVPETLDEIKEEEETKLTSTDLGIGNSAQSGQVSLANVASKLQPEWIAFPNEGEFRAYEIPEDFEIVLEVDAEQVDVTGGKKEEDKNSKKSKDAEEKSLPSIYISPSSEMTPFVLEIYLKDDSDIMVKVSGDETGRLWIGDDEEG